MRPPGKGNLEEFARRERYRFLEKAAAKEKAFAIVTAHTKNDQAETFLMNLIRGSGPAGLAAMPAKREMGSGTKLVRPLLSWATRAETHAYCTEHGVEYRIDPMNEDVRFTRVRIRKELIPKLAEYNPRIIETLSRTAGMLAGLETAHDPATEESPAVSQLQTLAQPDLYRSIRAWLKLHRGHLRRLEVKHIESIGRLIHSRKSGRTAELPGGERVVKQNGRLVFVHRRAGDSDKG
jgi:tRNA(Ile)-lysidine synthase